MCIGLHVKYPLFLSDFNETCFMWTDGRTDMTKLIVAFRNFAKAPKNRLIK